MKLADFRPTRHNVTQFIEYMIGGGVYFWSGYITFAILYSGFGWAWFPAKIVDDIVGSVLGYLVQRYWAFRNKRLTGHDAEIIKKYSIITAVTYVIDYLIIWGLDTVGISPYVGFFISAGFFTVWNYLWYRFWVFYVKRSDPKKEGVGV
ncbi:MAG TPA: GtrA family protein [Candidatus Saccharimonadales bacterium]|nr:GtrA family protein [Candidatus Saccharimonadales bacterium]